MPYSVQGYSLTDDIIGWIRDVAVQEGRSRSAAALIRLRRCRAAEAESDPQLIASIMQGEHDERIVLESEIAERQAQLHDLDGTAGGAS